MYCSKYEFITIRFIDRRKTGDKDLFAGFERVKDKDTAVRSHFVGKTPEGECLYMNPLQSKQPVKPATLGAEMPRKNKFSSLIGSKFSNMEQNTNHVIKSVISDLNVRGASELKFIMECTDEDSVNEGIVIPCLAFVKEALSDKSIYQFNAEAFKKVKELQVKRGRG